MGRQVFFLLDNGWGVDGQTMRVERFLSKPNLFQRQIAGKKCLKTNTKKEHKTGQSLLQD